MNIQHTIKLPPQGFALVRVTGTIGASSQDKHYEVGDIIRFLEYDVEREKLTGSCFYREVAEIKNFGKGCLNLKLKELFEKEKVI